MLWNFGKELKKLDVSSGYMMGSILAPNAVVTLNVNVDGNIVAEVVNVKGGESHRWDLQPSKPKVPKLPDNEFIVPPPLPEDLNKDKPGSDDPGKDEKKPKSEDLISITDLLTILQIFNVIHLNHILLPIALLILNQCLANQI